VRTEIKFVGFEVFTAVVLKSIFFWDMTPCSALSGTRRFGGTYLLHLRTTRRHIPEEDTLQKLSYKCIMVYQKIKCINAMKHG
jgi:hypothetical protein